MVRKNSSLRVKMLLTTAAIASVAAPGGAYAQIVNGGDLVGSVNSMGNPGQITIVNPTATTATIDVLASTVIAEWAQFNVPVGTTLDVTTPLAQANLLNRVIGAGASDIGGTVNAADVNLWLINQDGILFGSTSAINANSFVASTLDVSNQDFFDFGEGTDVFANGSSTVNFAGASVAAISSAGGTITTDGTLFFASQALDITGTYDAGSGRAAFVAASDVDVQFNPGSPLGYTITGGTTVASQTVGGEVTGAGVEFQMVSAAGVVGALLQVDANLTATTAVPTETGILLQASGLGADQPSVRTNGFLSSAGIIDIDAGENYTATDTVTGDSVIINAMGSVIATASGTLAGAGVDITATGAGALLGVDATNGRVATGNLISAGDILTESGLSTAVRTQTAAGSITGVSGATYDSGKMTATNGFIDVMSTGNATIAGYMSGGDTNVISSAGNVDITAASRSAGDSTLTSATRNVSTQAITTTAGGNIDLNARRDLTSIGILNADGDVTLDAELGLIDVDSIIAGGNINTISKLSTTTRTQSARGSVTGVAGAEYTSSLIIADTGPIDVTSTDTARIAGYNSGGAASITSLTDDVILTASSTSVGASSLTANNGSVLATTTGTVGGQRVNITTTGAGSLLEIDASERVVAGNLLSGGDITTESGLSTAVRTQTAAGSIAGVSGATYDSGKMTATSGFIDVMSTGNATIAGYMSGGDTDVISSAGNVDITAASRSAGDSTLTSTTRNVSTQAITTTAGGNIDLYAKRDLTSIGILNADGDVTLEANLGLIDVDAIIAGGNIDTTSKLSTTTRTQSARGSVTGVAGAEYTSSLIISDTGPIDVTSTDTARIAGYNSGGAASITSLTDDAILTASSTSVGPSSLTANNGSVLATTTGTLGGPRVVVSTTGAGSLLEIDAAERVVTGNLLSGGDITTESGLSTSVDLQAAAGSITGVSGATYDSGKMTATNGFVDVMSTGNATIAGYMSGGDTDVISSAGNVDITAASISDGDSALTSTIRRVNTQGITSTGGDIELIAGRDVISSGDLTAFADVVVDGGLGIVDIDNVVAGGDINTISGLATTTGTQMAGGSVTGDAGTTYTSDFIQTTTGSIDVESGRDAMIAGYMSGDTATVLSRGADVTLTADASSVGTSSLMSDFGFVQTERVTTTGMGADIILDAGTAVRAHGELSAFNNVDVDANTSITYTSIVAGNDIDLMAGTFITGDAQTATGSVTGNAGTNYISGLITATDFIDVESSGTAIIAGYNSDGTATVLSTGGNVSLTADASSVGTSSLTSDTGLVTTQGVAATGMGADIILDGGTAVRANGDLNAFNNVDVDANTSIVYTSIVAGNDIDLMAGTFVNGGTQTAGNSVTGDAGTTYNSGLLTSTTGPILVTSTGDATIAGYDAGSTIDVTSSTGDVDITAAGSSAGTSTLTSTLGAVNTQALTTTAGGDIDLNAQTDITTTGTLDASGSVIADATTGFIDLDDVMADVNVDLSAATTLTTQAVVAGGFADIDSGGDLTTTTITAVGDIDLDTGAALTTTALHSTGGNITTDSVGNTVTGTQMADAGSITGNVTGPGSTYMSAALTTTPGTGPIVVTSTGDATIAGYDAGSTIDVTSSTGDVDITAAGSSAGTSTLTSTLGAVNTQALTTTAGGDIDLNAQTDITTTGTLDASGSVIADATTGFIDLDDVMADVNVDLSAATTLTTQAVVAGGFADIDSGGDLTTTTITAVGDIDLDTGAALTTTALHSTGGNITTDSVGNTVTGTQMADAGSITGNVTGPGSTYTSAALTTTPGTGPIVVTSTGDATIAGYDAGSTIDVTSSTGDVDITAAGSSAGTSTLTSTLGAVNTQALTTTAGGDIDLNAQTDITTTGTLDASGSVIADATTGFIDLDDVMADVNVDLSAATTLTTQAVVAGGFADIDSGGDLTTTTITAVGDIDLDTGAALTTTALHSTGGNITTDSVGNTVTGTQMADAGSITGNVTGPGSTYTSAALTTTPGTGPIVVTSTGDATIAGYDAGSTIDVTSSTGDVDITAAGSSAGTSTLTSTLGAVNTQALTTTAGGDIDLNAQTDITTTGTLDASGSVIADATTGFIDLDDVMADVNVDLSAATTLTTQAVVAGGFADIDSGGDLTTTTITAVGDIDLDTGAALTTTALHSTGGNITTDSVGNTVTGTQMADAGSITGNVTGPGSTYTSAALTTTPGTGPIVVTSTGDATIAGYASGSTATILSTGGDVTLTADASSVGTSSLTSTVGAVNTQTVTASAVVMDAGTSIDFAAIVASNSIDLTAGTSINGATQTAADFVVGNAGTTYNSGLITTNGSVAVTAGGLTNIDDVSSAAGDSVIADDVMTIAGIDSGGATTLLAASGDIVLTGDITSTGLVDIDTLSGDLIARNLTTTAGSIDIDSAGTGNVWLGDINASGDILTDASGLISTGTQVATGSVIAAAGATYTSDLITTNALIDVTSTDDVTIAGYLSGDTATVLSTGGDVVLTADASSAGTSSLMSTTGAVSTQMMTTSSVGSDIVVDAGTSVTTADLTSLGGIDIDSTGGGSLEVGILNAGSTVDLDTSGTVLVGMSTAGGAFSVGANTLVASANLAGDVSALDVDINTSAALTAQNIAATGGAVDIDSGSVIADALTASDDIFVDGAGSVNLVSADAVDQLVIGATTPPSSVTVSGVSEGASVGVTASGLVDLNTVNSTAGDIDVMSSADSIVVATASSLGGDTRLAAAGNVTVGTINSEGAIDVDSMDGGTLDAGVLNAGTSIDLDTSGSVIAGTISAGTVLSVGGSTAAADVNFNDVVDAGSVDVTTSGTFSAEAAVDGDASVSISSGDIDLAVSGSLTASDVLLRVTSSGQVILGEGTGVYILNNDELSRVVAEDVVIDAQSNDVGINGVTFTDDAGANSFNVATVGQVNLTGDVTADGAGRTFGFGGSAEPDGSGSFGLASRITADIDNASYDFGAATVIVRGADIVFGREAFISDVEGRSTIDINGSLIGNSASSLYNSLLNGQLSADRTADPIYLRAGNLVVVYENTALFQNTGLRTGGANQTIGVNIGEDSGSGTLTINSTDDTNAFALFGQINDLIGETVAVAGPSIVIIGDTVQLGASRINGCQIGSGADCITTQVGATTVDVPRETVNLLEADGNLSVPFDPLVGTSNEGLFSDATSYDATQDCLRGDNGECVAPQGSQ